MGSRINDQNKRPARCVFGHLLHGWVVILVTWKGYWHQTLVLTAKASWWRGQSRVSAAPQGAPRQRFYCSLWDPPHKSSRLLWSYYPPGLNQSISFSIPHPVSAGRSLHSHTRVEKTCDIPPGAISVEPVQKGAGGGFLGGQADAARGQGWEHPGSPDHQGSRAEPLQAKDSTGNASPPHSSTSAYSCSITSWKPTARGKVPPRCPTSST